MTLSADVIGRIIRGIIGVTLTAAGIYYNNWIGFLGAFLLIGAITGGGACGFGSSNCAINTDEKK